MVKIYTRTGDKGETSLFGGKRVAKDDPEVEAIGTIDELNSTIGVVITKLKTKDLKLKNELISIQKDLFEIGASLNSPNTKYLARRVSEFEKIIDNLSEKLPETRNFILPGGGKGGSFLHFARAIARRAEREIVTLSRKEKINQSREG